MSGSIEDPLAKLTRALDHYKVLYNDLHGGVNRKVHTLTLEPHGEALEYIIRVGDIEPLSPDVSLAI